MHNNCSKFIRLTLIQGYTQLLLFIKYLQYLLEWDYSTISDYLLRQSSHG